MYEIFFNIFYILIRFAGPSTKVKFLFLILVLCVGSLERIDVKQIEKVTSDMK